MPGRYSEVAMVALAGGKEARNVYCLAMALYCPLPGQYSAIARQYTTRREEEGEATRRRRKKKEREVERKRLLSLLLFTLHQIV